MDYKDTLLWKKSLGNGAPENHELREKLIKEYENVRENAKYVLKEIRKDFPGLTVHDINHVDALWQVASVITGRDYIITPLEGFVLGCAFLLHDAVLSYYAVGGKDKLRSLNQWKDYYEDYKKDSSLSEDEILYEVDFKTVRLIHAEYAEKLYRQLFTKTDGSSFYIISDQSLRDHYGELISQIAGSHHWNIEDVSKLDDCQPVTSEYPQEWHINALKLACILRCADAGHIDDSRAPDYLFELLKVNGVSRDHWIAQNRLAQIDVDRNDPSKAIIKSTKKFSEKDFAAWNVCYDAVTVLDRELKSVNELLRKKKTQTFQVQSVLGADSREALSKYIKTDGWKPYDASVHIGDVEKLIQTLGGEKLYGKSHKLEIVIRELIQNARDAILARRMLESDYSGKIQVSILKDDEGTWVSVNDDGIGMSEYNIKQYLLGFGDSYWHSDLLKKEYPGLNSSGFKSIGRFGIGFYSVFMIASKVIVETRKYDAALDTTIKLTFPTGLCLRPIVSVIKGSTRISTSIRFLIDSKKSQWSNKFNIKPAVSGSTPFDVPYSAVIANITAGLDVDVYYKEPDKDELLIHKNIINMQLESEEIKEWLKEITFAKYRHNNLFANYIEDNYKRLKRIVIDDKFYGIAALNTLLPMKDTFFDVTTIGGLSNCVFSNGNDDYLGYINCEPITAKRESNDFKIDRSIWALEQYQILLNRGLSDRDKLYLPYSVGKYGIDMTDVMRVKVAYKSHEMDFISVIDLVKNISSNKMKLILGLASASLSVHYRIENYMDNERSVNNLKDDELLFVPVANSGFLNLNDDSSFKCNLMWCLNKVSRNLNLIINTVELENKIYAHLFGEGNALEISFYPNDIIKD